MALEGVQETIFAAREAARYIEVETMVRTHCWVCGDRLPSGKSPVDGPWCDYRCAAQPVVGAEL